MSPLSDCREVGQLRTVRSIFYADKSWWLHLFISIVDLYKEPVRLENSLGISRPIADDENGFPSTEPTKLRQQKMLGAKLEQQVQRGSDVLVNLRLGVRSLQGKKK